jgi:hypothetical protein
VLTATANEGLHRWCEPDDAKEREDRFEEKTKRSLTTSSRFIEDTKTPRLRGHAFREKIVGHGIFQKALCL